MSTPEHSDEAHADEAHADHGHHEMSFIRKYIFSTDHKVIGIQFLFTGLFMFLIGGLLVLLIRWQLAYPADMGDLANVIPTGSSTGM